MVCQNKIIRANIYKTHSTINEMKGVNRKGMSTVIATLIIILLVFVAAAILWVVIRNLVTGGSSQLDLTSKCLDTEVVPTKINLTSPGVYQVTVLRNSGDDEIGGIKIIFTSESGDVNYIHDAPGDIENLRLKTETVTVQDVTNPDKIEVVVYFNDKSGNQQMCQGGSSLEF